MSHLLLLGRRYTSQATVQEYMFSSRQFIKQGIKLGTVANVLLYF